ncbi:MAG: hypothetical protein JWO22_1730 [Frankiales bacterium]|nr:hypothetical protein [Frankiales bacterium]
MTTSMLHLCDVSVQARLLGPSKDVDVLVREWPVCRRTEGSAFEARWQLEAPTTKSAIDAAWAETRRRCADLHLSLALDYSAQASHDLPDRGDGVSRRKNTSRRSGT